MEKTDLLQRRPLTIPLRKVPWLWIRGNPRETSEEVFAGRVISLPMRGRSLSRDGVLLSGNPDLFLSLFFN
jgi:hypothetical protein